MVITEKGNQIGSKSELVEAELFEAIAHPTRIKILQLLNTGVLGFAELKRKLGISSSGNLSHHLNKLVTLIATDAQGKYVISDQGKEALLAIKFTRDHNWMATSYAAVSALLFYGIFLTAAILSGLIKSTIMPDILIIVGASIATIIYFVIFRRLFAKAFYRQMLHSKWNNNETD